MIPPAVKKYQQREALAEKQKERELPVELLKMQNHFNKQNIEKQHEFNLDIFKKQKKLTITITIITATCSIAAGIVGAIFGYFLNCNQQKMKQEMKTQTSITQPQDITSNQKVLEHSRQTKTKSSAQGESSSNTLKKP